MKKKFLLFVLTIALFSSALPAFAADYVEGQLMVTIAYNGTKLSEMPRAAAKNIIAQKADEVAAACGGTAKCYDTISISQNKIVAVITSKTKTTAEMQAICEARKDVLSAKPNRIFRNRPRAVPKTTGNANSENATAGNGSTVDDPLFPDQWALCGTHGLKATAVWGVEQGSPDVVVAIVDGGVDFSHVDLADNIAILKKTDNVTVDNAKEYRIENTYIGKAYVDKQDKKVYVDNAEAVTKADKLPLAKAYAMADAYARTPSGETGAAAYNDLDVVPDHDGHGSHIAGIIAAVTNNAKGMAGLARGCKIASFCVTAVNYANNNPDAYWDTPACIGFDNAGLDAAWEEVAAQKQAGLNIRVANASYGAWKSDEPDLSDPEYLALKTASDEGIIICVSAGNETQDIDNPTGEDYKGKYVYPVCYKELDPELNMIVVGAVKSDGNYDNTGKDGYSNWGAKSVDIAAPGTKVYGAVPKYEFFNECNKDGVYCTWAAEPLTKEYSKDDGTSFATPYVTASAALLCSHYPDKSADEIIKLLYDNADTKFKGIYTTYGNLNIARALNATSESSTSGCNSGFGALMLLFVIALPAVKKYGKKAA